MQGTRSNGWCGWLTGLLALCAGCVPSKFDGLSAGHGSSETDDASAVLSDAGMDASEPEPEPPPDASDDESATATTEVDATVTEAGATDAMSSASDAGADAGACASDGPVRPLRVPATALELARLSLSSDVNSRTLGPTLQLATSRVWTFTNTRLRVPDAAPPARPFNYPSSARDGARTPWTQAAASSDWQLDDLRDMSGSPASLLALLPVEQGLNVSIAIAALIRDPDQPNVGLGFARKSIGLQAVNEVWSVRLAANASQATRGAQPLFKSPEPLFGQAAIRDGSFVKAFACSTRMANDAGVATGYPCLLARAPVGRLAERVAYEFYSVDAIGRGTWTSDLTRATAIVEAIDGGALSVSFNAYLRQFLMVYSKPVSDDVSLRSAPTIEGPWSEPLTVKLSKPPYWFNFEAREHDSLAQRCGQRIIVSAWAPQDGETTWPTFGDVTLSAIDLQ